MAGVGSGDPSATRTPARLSILILNWRDTGHPEGGGSEVYVEHLADGLAALGHAVTSFTAAYPGAPSEERRPSGVRAVRHGGHLSVYLRAVTAYLRGRLGRPDAIIEVHNGVPFLARLWARRIPVIVLVHHVHREQWRMIFGPVRARFGWWLESWLAPRVNRSNRYVAVSDVTRIELLTLGIPGDHIDVIRNGTPAPLPERIDKTAHPSLLVLGRLVPHKRIEIALKAVAALRDTFPDLTLTIAGRGWWESKLRHEAEALGVQDRVHFAGFVSPTERHRLYSQGWVSLVPSLKEGWGLVVVEAGAHGTPSVGFHGAGGVADSIVDECTGLLARHDDINDFAAQIGRLLGDAPLRARLGADAATYARRFTWDVTVKSFDDLLARVTAAEAPRCC